MTLSKYFAMSQCFLLGLKSLLVLLSEGLNVHPGRLELSTHAGRCGGVGLRLAASDVGGALAALFQPAWQAGGQWSLRADCLWCCFGLRRVVCPWPVPFLCRITALMGSMVAGAGVNPADQHWGFWPLLPLGS